MRIVCPRCVAQYEVDDTAIPESGREVQCANCENIWFQDYIEMLPDRPAEPAPGPDDTGVFDDLDGKADATFTSTRRKLPPEDDDPALDDEEDFDDPAHDDPAQNLLTEEPDADGFDDDEEEEDDAPNPDMTAPAVDEEVLDVLRSEAAFSSARAKIDAATAQALDGDGAERKHSAAPDIATPEVADPEPAAEPDDLAAFLDAHAEEEPEAEPGPQDNIAETAQEPEPQEPMGAPERDVFDPLADLDAIRSQLAEMDAAPAEDQDTSAEPTYTPNLPPDDPLPEAPAATDDTPLVDDVLQEMPSADPEPDEVADLAEQQDAQDQDEADDFDDPDDFFEEEERPRRAYRADGGQPDLAPQPDPDPPAEPEPEPEPEPEAPEDPEPDLAADIAAAAAPAAAAVGLSRPRAKGGRKRARSLAGFEAPAADETPEEPDTFAPAPQAEPEPVAEDLPVNREPDHTRRPKKERAANRKALLPDVDELDASLRSEAEQPRRRDRELMEAHEEELKRASGGGFRRAFVWTILVVALCLALYVLRPQIVAAVPAAAIVLDPYAAVIDSLRLLIDGLLGG